MVEDEGIVGRQRVGGVERGTNVWRHERGKVGRGGVTDAALAGSGGQNYVRQGNGLMLLTHLKADTAENRGEGG
jgi:hypothetical protein